jgi:hypothetical protein
LWNSSKEYTVCKYRVMLLWSKSLSQVKSFA